MHVYIYICICIYIYIHTYVYKGGSRGVSVARLRRGVSVARPRGEGDTPGLRYKIPALKNFARGWVAQEPICRVHPVSVTRFPSFRTQPLENLKPLPMNKWVPEPPSPWRKSAKRESCYGDRVYATKIYSPPPTNAYSVYLI